MKLLRMSATFGKLEQQTLTLHEGLNLITLPNEAGKSTWAEFLLAMLYGVDTAERERAGVLPIKAKYQPWSGKPMSGSIELEHEGARITLTRTSTARAPLGVFSAVYTDSGLPVAGMTAQNCGELLLGVPKSVYQRSAFVRQAGLGLTPDPSLEARLSALVTTGDETVSFSEVDRRLQVWQNRIRHNKTGLIPEHERALAQTQLALDTLAEERARDLSLHAQLQTLQSQRQQAQLELEALRALDTQQKKQQLYEAKRAAMQAANRENAAAAVCARLPDEQTLQALAREAQRLSGMPEPTPPAAAPEKPACPAAFLGVDEAQLMDKAQRDMREFDRLSAKKYRPAALFFALAALFAALSAGSWLWLQTLFVPMVFALAGVGSLLLALLHRAHNVAREQELSQAQQLLQLYENHSRDEFSAYAADYREALRVWSDACSHAAQQREQYAQQTQLRAEQAASLLGSVRMFAQAESVQAAQAAISNALSSYGAYHEAQIATQQANARHGALVQAYGALEELPIPESVETPTCTQAQAEAALARTQALCMSVQSQLDQSRGRLEQLGSEAELNAKKQAIEQQLEQLELRQQALTLARQTLERANTTLLERFSPRLVQEASAIFSALTDGRYARVQIDRQMNLAAGGQDDVLRRLLSLSHGAADGLYLSVRLAICRLLLPDSAPIVLDDALSMLDDQRLALALRLLQQEAQHRQVLLFTCQGREQALLAP